MSIEARPINESVLGFKTTSPSAAVSLCSIDLTSGNVDSVYFNADQRFSIEENARPLLAVIDPEDRELTALGLLMRLLPVSSLDAGAAALTAVVADGKATAVVPVAGTRYFAVQIPHSIVGGVGFSAAEGYDTLVSADNSFKTTSPEIDFMASGMLVARNRAGPGVVLARADDLQRMPAVGMIDSIKDGRVTVQTSGPVVNRFTATGSPIFFVGLDSWPATSLDGIIYGQSIGMWATSNTFILAITSGYVTRSI